MRMTARVPRAVAAADQPHDRNITERLGGLRECCLKKTLAEVESGPPRGVYAIRYTQVMPKTVPVREFRTKLSELLSDVADRRDHVLITRNGKPAAVLVPIDEYEALEETAEILSDSVTLAQIETGLKELAQGDSETLEQLRRELAERRASR
jgi:antitoxin YefM